MTQPPEGRDRGAGAGDQPPPPSPPTPYAPVNGPVQPGVAYGNPYAVPAAPPQPKGLSITAFVLGLLGCLPLLSVAAIVVGIVALAKKQALKGLAAAGIALGVLWIAASVALVATGVVEDFVSGVEQAVEEEVGATGPTDEVGEPGDATSWDLRLGDCFNDPHADDPELSGTALNVVDCGEPHEFEVYAEATLEGDTFPGEDETVQLADEACIAEFDTFIGMPYEDSSIYSGWFAPNEESWTDFDDRLVICIATDPNDPLMVGSLRNAQR